MTTKQALSSHLRAYYNSLKTTFATKQATEHSYRSAFENLIQEFGGKRVRALNEPKRIACGAPDFIVERGGVPIGHVECKDIDIDLNRVERDDQLTRYRESLPNLILTDYLEFRWYVEGDLRLKARLAHIDSRDRIAIDQADTRQVAELFTAFFDTDPPSIGRPRELAERMAAKARLLRGSIELILDQENETGPLHSMLTGYREVLIGDLSIADFADLQAQTAAYGLFAARCRHEPANGPFTRQSAAFAETTPFLRDVFGRIAGPGMDERIAWIVDDLAYLLDRADMASILSEFGKKTRQEDPVVHFYEDFLAAYDPRLRKMRGVYYTPEPVVSYIVRSVDHLLRARFDLADGLADTATVASEDGKSSRPRVMILDPAAGTGTFLREVVATIRETIKAKGLGGAWLGYVQNHLLPRLFGFELLMAPYSICHLKLALEIGGIDHGFAMPAGKRLNVFLTNALEKAHEGPALSLFVHEIAREAIGADEVKRDKPVMVVLGNPPYSGDSANRGEWIKNLLKGRDGEQTTGNYFEVDGQPLGEQNSKWLHDDYVKFIRFAQWRIERTGEGVLGFVTNHSYLDNPTFRGMRNSLMATFDEIYLLDLHGNAKKKERTPNGGKDENVFDIQQGVAIGLFVKHKDSGSDSCRVFHADLWGERESGPADGKYGWLAAKDVDTTQWTELSPKSPDYLFVPRDEEQLKEYKTGWKVTDIFPINSTGIVSKRDKIAFHFEQENLYRVLNDFHTLDEHTLKEKYNFRESRDGKVNFVKKHIQSYGIKDEYIKLCLYRPFDYRWTYYTDKSKGFLGWPVYDVMRHVLAGENLGLSTTRSTEIAKGWEHVFASKDLIQHHTVSLKEVNYLFPLYTYPAEKEKLFGSIRTPNLNREFIEEVEEATALAFIPDGPGDLETTFGPEDVFYYIYAVLHSPEYRRRYADFLKSDFPRVPTTNCGALFKSLAAFGKRLTALHLMEADDGEAPIFPATGKNRVEKVSYAPSQKRVWINGEQYFDGVAPDTWEFTIGGYQPAEKWLKDRKNRPLSYDDIAHYCRLCAALAETPRIMASIDETIEAYGGWPLVQEDYLRGLYQTMSEEWTSPEDEEAWRDL